MESALILGGSRFIGFHLTQALLQRGVRVSHLRRGLTPPPRPFSGPVETFLGNRDHPQNLGRAFQKKYSAVFDLSGYSPDQVAPILAEHRNKIGQYIFCSSSNVVRVPPPTPYREDSPTVAADGASAGGKKLQIENLLRNAWHEFQLPITILRAQGVLGIYDEAQAGIVYSHLETGKKFQIPEAMLSARLNLLDVNDLVQAFILAAENTVAHGKIYNIANNEAIALRDFIQLCAELSGTEPRIDLQKSRSAPCEWWHHYNLEADNARIKNDLHLEFTPLRSTLEGIWQWRKQNPRSKWRVLAAHVQKLLVRF